MLFHRKYKRPLGVSYLPCQGPHDPTLPDGLLRQRHNKDTPQIYL